MLSPAIGSTLVETVLIPRRGRSTVAADGLELARAAGANATLSKPFSIADLFRTVDNALRAI